jgi:type II secretory ATPase GspE/PulE/Tfp pilus assembly ATPase PilB-like protein
VDEEPTEAEVQFAASNAVTLPHRLRHPAGCAACKRTGFKGRIPIGEAFHATDELLRAVAERRPAPEIDAIAVGSGLAPMTMDGFAKALAGETTLEEVLAAVHG